MFLVSCGTFLVYQTLTNFRNDSDLILILVEISAQLLTQSVTLENGLNLSELQFPHHMGGTVILPIG